MHSEDLAAVIARARSHSLGDIPRRSARKQPDKTAIIDGDVVLSFADFDRLVDRAAAAFHDNGLRPGDRVALLAHNCWQYAVLAFATARAGVVLVPINFMLTAEEIAYILGHSKATAFLVEADLVPVAEQAMALSPTVTTKVALIPDGQSPACRLVGFRRLAGHDQPGTRCPRRRRPAAAGDVHQRYRVAAQRGGHAQQPQPDVAIHQHHRGRLHVRR